MRSRSFLVRFPALLLLGGAGLGVAGVLLVRHRVVAGLLLGLLRPGLLGQAEVLGRELLALLGGEITHGRAYPAARRRRTAARPLRRPRRARSPAARPRIASAHDSRSSRRTDGGRVGERQVGHRRRRDDVHVEVGHLVAGDDQRRPARIRRRPSSGPCRSRGPPRRGGPARSGGASIQWSISAIGTTRVCPGAVGLIDRKATQRSSRHTNVPGISPAMIRENSVVIGRRLRSEPSARRPFVTAGCWPYAAGVPTVEPAVPAGEVDRILTVPTLFTLARLLCLPLFLYLLFGRDNRAARGVAARPARRHRLGRRLPRPTARAGQRVRQEVRPHRRPPAVHRRPRRDHHRRRRAAVVLHRRARP